MGTFKSLEEVREHFRNDHFATENGMEIDAFGENHCRCSMRIAITTPMAE